MSAGAGRMEFFEQNFLFGCPASIFSASELTADQRLCYVVLRSFGPKCWASYKVIAQRMGRSRPVAIQSVEALRKAAWISIETRSNDKGQTTNMINFLSFTDMIQALNQSTVLPLETDGGGKGRLPPPSKGRLPKVSHKSLSEAEEAPLSETPVLDFKQAIGIYKRVWSGHYQGEAYGTTKADPGALNAFIKANPEVGPELFESKAQGYLIQGDAWIKARRHPMLYLCSQWNSWRPVTLSPEKPRVNL